MSINREAIAERMEVVAADGRHMGIVDHVDGDRITLAKRDTPDGEHHFIRIVDVREVRDGKIWLDRNAAVR